MKKVKIKFKRLHKDAQFPTQAHKSDFGFDVWAVSEEEVAPNVWKYGLGFALQVERNNINYGNLAIDLRPRSSVWQTGMVLSNCIGTIDEGYTGEISAVFYHVMPDMPRYKVGERIGQIYLNWAHEIMFIEVEELDKTEREGNGYGSTGKR